MDIDLSSGQHVETQPLEYFDDYIGGRLLASRLYWDNVPARVGALDPENVIMIFPGPLGGTQSTACSRWVITAKSPHSYPDQYGFGNGGGLFGAALKQSGYDGLIVRGKASGLSYILIENNRMSICDAAGLRGVETLDTINRLKKEHGANAHVVCIGPAGENLVRFATAQTEQGGTLSNGMGAVLGSKNLKAIVVVGGEKVPVADSDRIKNINKEVRRLSEGQNRVLYMSEPMQPGIENVRSTPCYGCPAGCMRAIFKHTSGREEVRQTCASSHVYTHWDQLLNGESTDIQFTVTSMCDRYGLCTSEVGNLLYWLYDCFTEGVMTEDETGLPLSQIGSLDFAEKLFKKIIDQDGFGELMAQGTRRASIAKGKAAEGIALKRIRPSGYVDDSYGGRLFSPNALFYATETRNPIIQLHEYSFTVLKWVFWYVSSGGMSSMNSEALRRIAKRAWGSEDAADFTTYDGKAKAAYMIQNREHAKESMVACDRYYPLLDTDQEDDGVGDPTFVSQFFTAVTGQEMTEEQYYSVGERSMNLQRAIMAREGRFGRGNDTIGEFNFTEPIETEDGLIGLFNPDLEFPGKGDEVVILKGKTMDRDAFEGMKDEYYELRNWDVSSGLQTEKCLDDLNLGFLSDDLKKLNALE